MRLHIIALTTTAILSATVPQASRCGPVVDVATGRTLTCARIAADTRALQREADILAAQRPRGAIERMADAIERWLMRPF